MDIRLTVDIINSLFELFAGFFAFFNVFIILKEKDVKGTSIISAMFFTLWSWWNLIYYFNLDQMFSFFASIGLAITNSVWVILAIWYKKQL